eukprot:349715-Chlamydomonas_euryale.AAC.8
MKHVGSVRTGTGSNREGRVKEHVWGGAHERAGAGREAWKSRCGEGSVTGQEDVKTVGRDKNSHIFGRRSATRRREEQKEQEAGSREDEAESEPTACTQHRRHQNASRQTDGHILFQRGVKQRGVDPPPWMARHKIWRARAQTCFQPPAG